VQFNDVLFYDKNARSLGQGKQLCGVGISIALPKFR